MSESRVYFYCCVSGGGGGGSDGGLAVWNFKWPPSFSVLNCSQKVESRMAAPS